MQSVCVGLRNEIMICVVNIVESNDVNAGTHACGAVLAIEKYLGPSVKATIKIGTCTGNFNIGPITVHRRYIVCRPNSPMVSLESGSSVG